MLYTAFGGLCERVWAFLVGGEPHWPIGALTNLKIIVTASILLNIFFTLTDFQHAI